MTLWTLLSETEFSFFFLKPPISPVSSFSMFQAVQTVVGRDSDSFWLGAAWAR